MEAVGPVTLALGGVDDEANFVEYATPENVVQRSRALLTQDLAAPSADFHPAINTRLRKLQKLADQGDDCRSGRPKPPPEKSRAERKPRKPSQSSENGAGSSRKRRSRNPAEQKLFLGQLEALGLLEAYRAAKIDATDPPDVQTEKRKVRNQIARQVNPVHTPRSQ